MISTIDLVDNRTAAGDTQPATQNTPLTAVYDPGNGDFYIRGYVGDSLSVIDGSTNRVVAEIAVPDAQNTYTLTPTVAADPANRSLFVTNSLESNLTVINGTTNQVTRSVALNGQPDGIVYDPLNGNFYISNWGNAEVNVVNASTYRVLANVSVGSHPSAILFDPVSDRVFVANWDSGNVSVIDPSTDKVVGNVSTGSYPYAMALDTHDDLVDVANDYNGGQGTVTILPAAALTPVVTISVGMDPQALAYAPTQDQLFVGNGGSGNVTVINQSTHGKVALPVGQAPQAVAYDPVGHDIYVLNAESYNVTILDPATAKTVGNVATNNSYAYGLAVDTANGEVVAVSEGSPSSFGFGPPPFAQANATVISPATNHAIASIPLNVYPWGVTYDPYDGHLIVADPGGNDTYLVNPATDAVDRIVPVGVEPKWSAVDPANGEVYVVDSNATSPYVGSVTVLNSSFDVVKTITTGYGPTGIVFDSANGTFYIPDNLGGNVTVINGTTNTITTVIPVAADEVLDGIGYDPRTDDVYVGDSTNDTVVVIDAATNHIVAWVHVGSNPTSFAFDPANDTMFVANEGSGNYSVIQDSTHLVVHTATLEYADYLAYDAANNLVYDAESFAGLVDVINATTYASAGPAISLGSVLYPHFIAYDPVDQAVYVTTQYQGSISVIASTGYSVTFVEAGLPASTPWSVTLGTVTNSSSTSTIGFVEPDGSFAFSVGAVSGYVANRTSGSVTVSGSSRTVEIGFSAVAPPTFVVTFTETGLPASTTWSVTLVSQTLDSSTTTVQFSEPNGSYSFTVGAVSGFSATPASGSVTVNGGPVDQPISFASRPGPLSVTLTASVSSLVVNDTTTLTATPSGGVAPFTFVWEGLPGGCQSANTSTLSCKAVVAGTFHVNVTVTDGVGGVAHAGTTLTVTSPSSTSPGSQGLADWEWAGLIGAFAVMFLLVLLAYRRRRKPSPATVTPSPQGGNEPGASPPPAAP